MNRKGKIGEFGQKIAADYLISKGYQLLDQNFFTRQGELDLIAGKEGQLIFIEVKTRLSRKFGLAEEAVSEQKIEKMRQTAHKYLAEKQINSDNFRFDIIAVEIDEDNKKANIRHHKNIED